MREDELIKKAFSRDIEELPVPDGLEERLFGRRRRFLAWFMPLGALAAGFAIGLFITQLWHVERGYVPMSEEKEEGVHVVFERNIKIGQVEDFLKERGLTMEGPTPAGTYLLKGAKEKDVQELKKRGYIREVFR
jgi:hypothetical protein